VISVNGGVYKHLRWRMLVVISRSVMALTLNWLDVLPPPLIGARDHQADLGEVEDLAAFGVDQLGIVQTGTTRGA
jgi:hypothetical protein